MAYDDISGIKKLKVTKITIERNSWHKTNGPDKVIVDSLKDRATTKDNPSEERYQIKDITFSESIFNPFVQGSIIFIDVLRTFSKIPLIGNEKISFQLDIALTDGAAGKETINLDFRVTRIVPQEMSFTDKTKIMYKIEFIEEAYWKFLKQTSFSFSGGYLSDMVKKMSKRLLGKEIIDDNLEKSDVNLNKDEMAICFPFSTFGEKLEYIGRYMRGENKNNFDYLYYSSLGTQKSPIITHYKTISSLLNPNKILSTFKKNFDTFKNEDELSIGIVESDIISGDSLLQFRDYIIEEAFDIVKAQKIGGLGMIGYYWDSTNSIGIKNASYDEVLKNQYHTGSALQYEKEIYSNRINTSYYSKFHSNIDVYELENNITRLNHQQSFAISVLMPGMWTRKLGAPIWVDMKDYTVPEKTHAYEESHSGLYLIKGITHIIGGDDTYNQVLSLMTTSQSINVSKNQQTISASNNLTDSWKNKKKLNIL